LVLAGHRQKLTRSVGPRRGAIRRRALPHGAVVFCGHKLSVPTKECLGARKRGDLGKELAPDGLGLLPEKASFGVGELKPLRTESFAKNPVLRKQIIDCHLLPTLVKSRHEKDE
jgi:hypothetical protein